MLRFPHTDAKVVFEQRRVEVADEDTSLLELVVNLRCFTSQHVAKDKIGF